MSRFCIIFLGVCVSFVSAVTYNHDETPIKAKSKVKVELLYETLCPYCKRLITQQLAPIMNSDLQDFIDLRLYPYGNAFEPAHGVFQCQHGKDECKLNKVAACGIRELHSDSRNTVSFINCVEKIPEPLSSNWHSCLIHAPTKKREIEACVMSSKGSQLLHQVGTYSKMFKYEYVPWVAVSGKHETGAEQNLSQFLCEKLKHEHTHFCAALYLTELRGSKTLKENERCYPSAQYI